MKKKTTLSLLISLVLSGLGCRRNLMQVSEVMAIPARNAESNIYYGEGPYQFGELRLPDGEGPFPVVAIIHGGCWLAQYDLHLMDAMATDLADRGYATWNLEYRRVGNEGGGWPGTFHDIADGVDYLRNLAESYPLDLDRVVLIGHSAGGHLALWAGSRLGLSGKSPFFRSNPVRPVGIVSLAGIVDLEAYLDREGNSCGSNVKALVDGLPEDVPERYLQTSPVRLPLMNIPRTLLTGKKDPIVPPEHVDLYLKERGDENDLIRSERINGVGHFEVIAPGSKAWPDVIAAIEAFN